jgi:hypothetical protein
MKNKILLMLILVGYGISAAAQQKPLDWSVKIYGGYGVLQPGADVIEVNSALNGALTDNQSYTYKNLVYNFGQSPHFGAGGVLKLTDMISVGVDFDYLTGSKSSSSGIESNNAIAGYSASYHALTLIPNASVRLFKLPGADIYNTIGLVASLDTKLDITITGQGGDVQQYHYGVNLGFKDAVGAKFSVAPRIHVFGEVSGFFFAPAPTKRVFPGLNGNGTTTQIFKSSGQVTDTTTDGNETYTEQNETPWHFSSIGLNVGVTIDLKK